MTMHALVSMVHDNLNRQRVDFPRDLILVRARQAWPTSVDFKDVQVRLLVEAITREKIGARSINRVLRASVLVH